MKQFICLLLIVGLVACKKDGSGVGSQKLLLTKTFRKGLLETENIYSTEGKKVRTNHYLAGGGTSTLSIYRLYQYNTDGTLKESVLYSKDHSPSSRYVYTYNAEGKISRIDEASIYAGSDDLDVMDFFQVFNYDNNGNLVQVVRRLTNYTMHTTTDYEYDNKGNLTKYLRFLWENGALVLKEQMDMEPGSKPMPEHWKKNLITPMDDELYEHFLNKKTYTSHWAGENVYVYTYKAHVYNSQGYITTMNYHYKSESSESDNSLTFEYAQQ